MYKLEKGNENCNVGSKDDNIKKHDQNSQKNNLGVFYMFGLRCRMENIEKASWQESIVKPFIRNCSIQRELSVLMIFLWVSLDLD